MAEETVAWGRRTLRRINHFLQAATELRVCALATLWDHPKPGQVWGAGLTPVRNYILSHPPWKVCGHCHMPLPWGPVVREKQRVEENQLFGFQDSRFKVWIQHLASKDNTFCHWAFREDRRHKSTVLSEESPGCLAYAVHYTWNGKNQLRS